MSFRDLLPVRKRTTSELAPVFNIQQQMNEIFDRFFTDWEVFPSIRTSNRFPSVDVSETDKEVCIKAELPGMEEKDIKLRPIRIS
jgi:HSP20 family protein